MAYCKITLKGKLANIPEAQEWIKQCNEYINSKKIEQKFKKKKQIDY